MNIFNKNKNDIDNVYIYRTMATVESFLSDWIEHPEYWFDPEKKFDTYITTTYQSLLETTEWNDKNINLYYHLACLILYDQIPRHVYRGKENEEEKISLYLEKALRIYKYIRKYLCTNDFTAQEWCFYCLPIRHKKESTSIIHCIQDTWMRLKKEENTEEKKVYTRFLKASYERMPLIAQKSYIEVSYPSYVKVDFHDFTRYFHILHHCPITESTIDPSQYEIYHIMEDFVVSNKIKRIILSLSGGVDSMVCGYILKKLQAKWKFELSAVHINYNNRSMNEYEFIKEWCDYMEIPMFTRHITEIQRAPCMEYGLRTTYETYTKQVRFQTYQDVWNHYLMYPDFPKVLLGHNHDDCFENILTNVLQKSKYENLQGMYKEQTIDNIIFYRPLLSIPKQSIYHFAHQAGIPYLHDSTPSWSQRGKIRDKVRPAIEEWSPEMIPSMFELASRISEYEGVIMDVVENMVSSSVKNTEKNTWTLTVPYKSTLFCSMLWGNYFRKMGISMHQKSLQHFLSQFEKGVHEKIYCEQGGNTPQIMLNKQTFLRYKCTKEKHVQVQIYTKV